MLCLPAGMSSYQPLQGYAMQKGLPPGCGPGFMQPDGPHQMTHPMQHLQPGSSMQGERGGLTPAM